MMITLPERPHVTGSRRAKESVIALVVEDDRGGDPEGVAVSPSYEGAGRRHGKFAPGVLFEEPDGVVFVTVDDKPFIGRQGPDTPRSWRAQFRNPHPIV
jgi:hypothetical protein